MLTKVVWKNNERLEKVNKLYTANWVIILITLAAGLGLYIYGRWLNKTNELVTVSAEE